MEQDIYSKFLALNKLADALGAETGSACQVSLEYRVNFGGRNPTMVLGFYLAESDDKKRKGVSIISGNNILEIITQLGERLREAKL